ncbi:MAG: hypothetical protein JWM11_7217 [Planctomycetaceae bacterium]|nr:hypothetical protein [Planctomycetaceae bacterium]
MFSVSNFRDEDLEGLLELTIHQRIGMIEFQGSLGSGIVLAAGSDSRVPGPAIS